VAEAAVNGLELVHPERVHLFWLAALLAGFLAWRELGRSAAFGGQLSAIMQRRLVMAPRRGRRLLRAALAFAGLALGIVALMQPQARGETEMVASGRVSADIMVALDVSRSMLADDAAPNRLARARAEIGALVDRLEGHRVGLVAFAGRAAVLCPLTPDHGFFQLVLGGVDTRSAARGGSRIGDGLRRALSAFSDGGGPRVILLITDGEDQDSRPLEAAKAAAAAGVRVVAIGFGSEEGSRITVTDPATGARSVVTDGPGGSPVISRLDGELLRQIALATKGAYVPAGTAALDLESILAEHLTPIVQSSAAAAKRPIPVERYPWFVLGALILFGAVGYLGGAPDRLLRRQSEGAGGGAP
jgi:Ca-activated chloride channel family protein